MHAVAVAEQFRLGDRGLRAGAITRRTGWRPLRAGYTLAQRERRAAGADLAGAKLKGALLKGARISSDQLRSAKRKETD